MINEVHKKGKVNLKYLQTFLSFVLFLWIKKIQVCISHISREALN